MEIFKSSSSKSINSSNNNNNNKQQLHPVNQAFADFENDHTPNFKLKSSKYRGVQKSISDYLTAIEAMENMTDQDVVATVRSAESEEEAAIAFDVASIKLKGDKAITNFNIKSYNVKAILDGMKSSVDDDDESTTSNTLSSSLMEGNNKRRNKKRNLTFHDHTINNILGNQTDHAEYFSSGINMANMLRENSSSPSSANNDLLMMMSSREEDGKSLSLGLGLGLGFQHSSSSAFKSYNGGDEESDDPVTTSVFKIMGSSVYLPPYDHDHDDHDEMDGAMFNDHVVTNKSEFNHASSSCFKPFKKP
ncbi:hypothetical protein CsatB_016453 [Cannabis sativa]